MTTLLAKALFLVHDVWRYGVHRVHDGFHAVDNDCANTIGNGQGRPTPTECETNQQERKNAHLGPAKVAGHFRIIGSGCPILGNVEAMQ